MNNKTINTILKCAAIVSLLSITSVATQTFINNQEPSRPTCTMTDMQYWLDSTKQKQIVSINESFVQNEAGVTKCEGYAKVGDNEYKRWSGWVTKTTNGSIGNARIGL